ncbi:MAG: hypothetical protein WC518_03975 [Patescibacteria group bacterium]
MPAAKSKKTKTGGAKGASKKIIRSRKKISAPSINTAKPAETAAAKKNSYIVINEPDGEVEKKSKLTWLVVGVLALIVLVFWFWTMKNNVKEALKSSSDYDLGQNLDQALTDLRGIINDSQKNLAQETAVPEQKSQLEQVKNDIIQKLQINLNSDNWPQHSSEILNLSLRYPPDWYKKEAADTLMLTSYSPATSTPKILGQVIITKKTSTNKLKLEEWLKLNQGDLSDYLPDKNKLFIDGQPALKYLKQTMEEKDISYLVYAGQQKNIYEINVYSRGGQDLFEPVFSQILSSLKFIK